MRDYSRLVDDHLAAGGKGEVMDHERSQDPDFLADVDYYRSLQSSPVPEPQTPPPTVLEKWGIPRPEVRLTKECLESSREALQVALERGADRLETPPEELMAKVDEYFAEAREQNDPSAVYRTMKEAASVVNTALGSKPGSSEYLEVSHDEEAVNNALTYADTRLERAYIPKPVRDRIDRLTDDNFNTDALKDPAKMESADEAKAVQDLQDRLDKNSPGWREPLQNWSDRLNKLPREEQKALQTAPLEERKEEFRELYREQRVESEIDRSAPQLTDVNLTIMRKDQHRGADRGSIHGIEYAQMSGMRRYLLETGSFSRDELKGLGYEDLSTLYHSKHPGDEERRNADIDAAVWDRYATIRWRNNPSR